MSQSVSVIMPALNEEGCIESVVSSIPLEDFKAKGFDVEVLVVDNGSTDQTADLARTAGARVVYEPRRGYGQAYRTGFNEAKGDIICTLDADGTYPASDLPHLVEKLLNEDFEFITTNRYGAMSEGSMSRINRIGNAILNFFSQSLFRLPFRDSQSGMWIFKRNLVNRMQLQSKGMSLSQEIKIKMACHLKVRCTEIPIHYEKRTSPPKLNRWRDGVGNLFHLLRIRFGTLSPTIDLESTVEYSVIDDYDQSAIPSFTYSGTPTLSQSSSTVFSTRQTNQLKF